VEIFILAADEVEKLPAAIEVDREFMDDPGDKTEPACKRL